MAAQKYWFKARGKRSVGWVPSTWQGWTMLALYVGLLIYSFFQTDSLFSFFFRFLLFSALLTVVTYIKGEPITWHHEAVKTSEESPKE